MSRCFPFPPPGYVLNEIRDVVMMESIKGVELEKAKKEHKSKKRSRDKKDKKRKERDGESEKHSHKRRRKEEDGGVKDRKNPKVGKLKQGGHDCLEKSSLTVKRKLLQQSTSRNSCDSTLNSNEKPKEKQHPCSTSAPEHASKPHEEKRKDHKEKMSSLSFTPEPYQPSRLCSVCPPSLAAQFLNVVENWVTTTIDRRADELTNSGDEECWWVMKKPSSNKFDTERCKQLNINNEIKQVTAWPCARLLPQADIHALPYTVPF